MSLLLLLVGWAAAAVNVAITAPEGGPWVGEAATIELGIADDGVAMNTPAPTITADQGQVLTEPVAIETGRWRFRYQPPRRDGPVGFVLSWGEAPVKVSVLVEPSRPPSLRLQAPKSTMVGTSDPVELRVSPREGSRIRANSLVFASSEGQLQAAREDPSGALILDWLPGKEPFPRAVPIGVLDASTPGSPPAWSVVPLRARPRIPVHTTPSSQLRVRVGGRRYGPFVAGADGVATAVVEVRPGETVAEVELTDPAGNVQRSTLTLGGDPRPALTLLAEPPSASHPARLYAHAVDAAGRPWRGAPPRCITSLGEPAATTPMGLGSWRVSIPALPQDAFFDLRVDCDVDGRTRASARSPTTTPLPTRLTLRTYPTELSAEAPRAQVQAFLENAQGDRLAADGVQLSAQRGELRVDSGGGAALRAEYRGEAAVVTGSDELRATWYRPTGAGTPSDLLVAARWDRGSLVTWVRVLNRAGLPLADVPVRVRSDTSSGRNTTNERGWARLPLPVPATPQVIELEARTGGLVRRTLIFAGQDLGPDPSAPDLQATLVLPIYASRVSEVFLSTEPRTLQGNRGSTARVIVRLVGAGGGPVTDEQVSLSASEGTLSAVRRRSDGAFEATYVPPTGVSWRRVRITASSQSGAFSDTTTEIALEPRTLHNAPGLYVGYLLGHSGLGGATLGASMDQRLPWRQEHLFGRVAVGFYSEHADMRDSATGDDVALRLNVLPVGLGLLTRQERRRLGLWAGSAVVLAPYHVEVHYGEAVPLRGLGLPAPGFEVFGGVGWRFLTSELTLEAAYLFLNIESPDAGWQGSIGGATARLGYRLSY